MKEGKIVFSMHVCRGASASVMKNCTGDSQFT
jgi:hypothetical protein